MRSTFRLPLVALRRFRLRNRTMASPNPAPDAPADALGDNPVTAYEENAARSLGDGSPVLDEADASVPLSRKPSYSYEPPSLPRTWGESFHTWLSSNPAKDSALAELHIYRKHTPYFAHATPGNVAMSTGSESLSQLWNSSKKAPPDTHPLALRATMGTEVAPDGKVAALRLVNVDIDESGSKPPSSSKGLFHRSNKVDKTKRLIHTLEVGDPTVVPGTAEWDAEPKVCVLHGYGAGSAFFFQNTKALAQAAMPSRDGSATVSNRLFALDWLGMGRSARVPFRPKPDLLDDDSVPSGTNGNESKQWAPGTPDLLTRRRVQAAENFFLDSFEAWRRTMQIERLVLVGHSLGAYLSLAYTLKYPERVDRLVLVSPAAIGISTFTV